MRKHLFILFFLGALVANSQTFEPLPTKDKEKNNTDFSDRIFFGGNIGLQIGTITFLDLSPLVGYKITDDFWAGIGGTYQYYRYKSGITEYSDNVYGGRVFARYFVLDNVFVHAEYEKLNIPSYFTLAKRINVESLFVGGGLRQALSDNLFLDLTILWNLNESPYSPYSNPVIRGGFNYTL